MKRHQILRKGINMNLIQRADFEFMAFYYLVESLKIRDSGDIELYYRKMSYARGIHAYFGNSELVAMCNKFFDKGIEKGELTEEESDEFKSRGFEKMCFYICLKRFRRDFLGKELRRQGQL